MLTEIAASVNFGKQNNYLKMNRNNHIINYFPLEMIKENEVGYVSKVIEESVIFDHLNINIV